MNEHELLLGNGLGFGPDTQVPPSTSVPWWQSIANFANKVGDIYNAAKPVVDSTKAAINDFKTGTANNPAFNYGLPGDDTEPKRTSLAAKVAIGVGIAGALGLGIYLATRKKKKALGEVIDTDAQVVASVLNGPKKKRKKRKK